MISVTRFQGVERIQGSNYIADRGTFMVTLMQVSLSDFLGSFDHAHRQGIYHA